MKFTTCFMLVDVATTALSHGALGQEPVGTRAEIITAPDDRAGPRVDVAVITRGSESARKELKSFSPITTLFGWQFEHPFDLGPDASLRVMTELVFLVGGLEQNVPLPSAMWILGIRQQNGFEFGVGPTLTLSGTQVAFAAGITEQYGIVNVPINLAVAPARTGASISVTAGFNLRR